MEKSTFIDHQKTSRNAMNKNFTKQADQIHQWRQCKEEIRKRKREKEGKTQYITCNHANWKPENGIEKRNRGTKEEEEFAMQWNALWINRFTIFSLWKKRDVALLWKPLNNNITNNRWIITIVSSRRLFTNFKFLNNFFIPLSQSYPL